MTSWQPGMCRSAAPGRHDAINVAFEIRRERQVVPCGVASGWTRTPPPKLHRAWIQGTSPVRPFNPVDSAWVTTAAFPGSIQMTDAPYLGLVEKRVPMPSVHVENTRHHVVVVGAGFGGLEAVHRLAGAPVSITVIDARNHHLFQPLLYQVATASLAPSEIAWPIRHLLRSRPEVTTLLATVVGVDAKVQRVLLEDGSSLSYDTLVLATGARHAYFGHDDWEPFAPGLKTLEDATTIRRLILLAFEKAERESNAERQAVLLTFVVIGAGPTGVELAGTIVELARDTLRRDFRNIDTRKARVVLIEAGPRVLAGFAEDLSAYAQRSLEALGVEVELGRPVSECTADGVVYGGKWLPGRNRHLGGRRAGFASRRMARCSGRPRRPPDGRARPHRSRTSRNLRHWRHGVDRRS